MRPYLGIDSKSFIMSDVVNPASHCLLGEYLRGCHSFQLVDGCGVFYKDQLDKFVDKVKLADCGKSYYIISIIGQQSSGKSTLLNHLFTTDFKELKAEVERGQTTQGIWLARCSIAKRCTLVLDLEGTDSAERARREDGAAFEKQSALFALAVSNIVLINIWCKDIGLDRAASRPLLRTVFKAMIRLFSPKHRVTLMFVLRDKPCRTPPKIFEDKIHEDVKMIWKSVKKPPTFEQTELNEVFNVEVVILPSYEDMEEQFKEQVAILRERLFHSIEGGEGSRDHQAVVPGSGFSVSAEEIWKTAKEDKDLDVPSHEEFIATKRCEDFATERTNAFKQSKEWRQLERAAQPETTRILGLGAMMNNMFQACLNMYDQDTQYYCERVRDAKRKYLSDQLLQLGHEEVCIPVLRKLHSETVEKFKEMLEKAVREGKPLFTAARSCKPKCIAFFDQGCAEIMVRKGTSEASYIRDKLAEDIDTHADNEKEKAQIRELEKGKRIEAIATAVGATVVGVAGAAAGAVACAITGGTAAIVIPVGLASSAVTGGSVSNIAARIYNWKAAPKDD